MTCIVGLKHAGKVYLGADSLGISQSTYVTDRSDKKLFGCGDFIFGFAGSYRIGQVIQYSFVPPERKQGDHIDKYMVTTFVDAFRECLKKAGCLKKSEEVEGNTSNFLIGVRESAELYCLYSDFQIGKMMDEYHAIGSGMEVARGSLFSTSYLKEAPKKRLTIALAAAEKHIASVRRPFFIIETKDLDTEVKSL